MRYMFGELLFFVGIMYFLPSVTVGCQWSPQAIFHPKLHFPWLQSPFHLRIIRSKKSRSPNWPKHGWNLTVPSYAATRSIQEDGIFLQVVLHDGCLGCLRAGHWNHRRKPTEFDWVHPGRQHGTFYGAAVKEDSFRGTTGNVNHKATYGYMSSWGLSRKFWWTPVDQVLLRVMELWSFFIHLFHIYRSFPAVFFQLFFWVKLRKKIPGGIGNGVSQPLLCIVFGDLIDSMGMCLGPAQSTLKPRAFNQWLATKSCGSLVWCRTGKFTVFFFFFGTYCTKKYKISGNFPGHLLLFLVEIWVSCCQMVWCDSWKVFHLKPTRGSALNSDFFLTARDVTMERWDPSNSGVDILAETWLLEDEFSF